MPITTQLQAQYISFMDCYLQSSAKIKISEGTLSPLAQINQLTHSLWVNVQALLDNNAPITNQEFFTLLSVRLANALENKAFIEYNSLKPNEKYHRYLNLLQQISLLEKEMAVLPASPNITSRNISNIERIEAQALSNHFRWGSAKNVTSILDQHQSVFDNLKSEIGDILGSLLFPDDEDLATTRPAKQTVEPVQVQLVTEMILLFQHLCPTTPKHIILDICHIYGFDSVDEETIKNTKRRIKNLLNQNTK
ncbi:hypothetical protein [Vibrio parahaemolyticus]|uniref:hypothetical protein n=1 Tax=Vibrio parahaemolyticus TaxID=670 RepID=UPI00215CB106|nr:hypothetical protein [Vibrio parahaemolyticus]MCR9816223.1 hypothetical protein [Vibrio parahaemolyticus]